MTELLDSLGEIVRWAARESGAEWEIHSLTVQANPKRSAFGVTHTEVFYSLTLKEYQKPGTLCVTLNTHSSLSHGALLGRFVIEISKAMTKEMLRADS